MYDCSRVTLSLRLTGGHVLFVLYLDSTVRVVSIVRDLRGIR